MKNIYLALVFLLILPSCYKKQVYEQYKKDKYGTVLHQQPKENSSHPTPSISTYAAISDNENVPSEDPPIDTSYYLNEMTGFTTYIGSVDELSIDTAFLTQGKVYTTFLNRSFEQDKAAYSTNPRHWKNCSNTAHASPVDIHTFVGAFQVEHEPSDGFRYVGMVVRDDETYESIGQYLEKPLFAGKKYVFSFYVSRAEDYISLSKSTMREENFNTPSLLRIWLGTSCYKAEIIAETNPITSDEWLHYTIFIEPEMDSDYLIFEAYYDENRLYPYNGNVLLDNISPIYELPSKN